jgi:hypothetical protein
MPRRYKHGLAAGVNELGIGVIKRPALSTKLTILLTFDVSKTKSHTHIGAKVSQIK